MSQRRSGWLVAVIVGMVCTLLGSPTGCEQQGVSVPPPGGIRLLPGYRHAREQGIDTEIGRIWRDGGPEIKYEIGLHSAPEADYISESKREVWSFEQVMNGRRMRVIMAKGDTLFVLFEKQGGNFVALHVRTPQDVTEVLLTVLTYTPPPL